MVSEFGCRWDKLKEFLRNDSGGEGVRVGSGGGGGTEPALAQLAADYEYGERFDGRNETTRDPVGVWVAPSGVEVLTLRWAKRYGPGLVHSFEVHSDFTTAGRWSFDGAPKGDANGTHTCFACRVTLCVHRARKD